MIRKWTYEKCMIAAKECHSRVDFKKKYNRQYDAALKNGWINDYTWFKTTYEVMSEVRKGKPFKWTYEKCAEEAKKYRTRKEMKAKSGGAWRAAKVYGWLDDFFKPFSKPAGWWNIKEHCLEEAKKYRTRTEFAKNSGVAYDYARKNKWLDECGFISWSQAASESITGKNLKWTKEKCYQVAKECRCRSELQKRFKGAYKNALKNGWINEYTWFKTPLPKNPMEKEYVIYAYEDKPNMVVYVGLSNNMRERHNGHKYSKKKDVLFKYCKSKGIKIMEPKIRMNSLTAIDAQYYENWYKKAYAADGWNILNIAPTGEGISSLGGGYRKFCDEDIINAANKYNSSSEFKEADPKMWAMLFRHNLRNNVNWPRRRADKWTLEICINEAKKYSSKNELRKNNYNCYQAAKKYKWLNNLYPKTA